MTPFSTWIDVVTGWVAVKHKQGIWKPGEHKLHRSTLRMCRGTRVYKLYENGTRSAIRESVYDEA